MGRAIMRKTPFFEQVFKNLYPQITFWGRSHYSPSEKDPVMHPSEKDPSERYAPLRNIAPQKKTPLCTPT